ncbi:hypothetical protein [Mobilicoccus pelagius]|uniref:hypothetical protein n=1 Tax=Mobilicoccus pelagius TaxID=746032 RepID=UPI001C3F2E8F|nr:hypothetical protein [Mobilicoccus pelagius]
MSPSTTPATGTSTVPDAPVPAADEEDAGASGVDEVVPGVPDEPGSVEVDVSADEDDAVGEDVVGEADAVVVEVVDAVVGAGVGAPPHPPSRTAPTSSAAPRIGARRRTILTTSPPPGRVPHDVRSATTASS